MTVNGIVLLNYAQSEDHLLLTLKAADYSQAVSVIAAKISIVDGIGNELISFSNFVKLVSVLYTADTQAYTLRLSQVDAQLVKNTADIHELEQQNKTLKAQLDAAIQSNQMLEDCLVEMAGVVYA